MPGRSSYFAPPGRKSGLSNVAMFAKRKPPVSMAARSILSPAIARAAATQVACAVQADHIDALGLQDIACAKETKREQIAHALGEHRRIIAERELDMAVRPAAPWRAACRRGEFALAEEVHAEHDIAGVEQFLHARPRLAVFGEKRLLALRIDPNDDAFVPLPSGFRVQCNERATRCVLRDSLSRYFDERVCRRRSCSFIDFRSTIEVELVALGQSAADHHFHRPADDAAIFLQRGFIFRRERVDLLLRSLRPNRAKTLVDGRNPWAGRDARRPRRSSRGS